MLYKFLKVLVKIIIFPLFRIEVHGKENLPADGAYIICGNHWSNWDPIMVAGAIDRTISFMAKKELFEIKIIKGLLKKLYAFPVDRDKTDLKSLRYAVDLIKQGKILCIFPEGTRVKLAQRKNIKDGAGYIALRAKANIIPVEIISTYKPFKKSYIYFKKPLYISDYTSYKKKEAMELLMDDTFKAIYENRLALIDSK
ncbi:MAG: lysophospholipid acyltransferase family protein [Peptoniphilaceae bacterium]|nr:lysophospholipid acyltransferase family protein [Peptoniphilaceae bacterium]MDY6019382.1 lysophospholipid acyltransferase family protein [Anaerococcus sp.]